MPAIAPADVAAEPPDDDLNAWLESFADAEDEHCPTDASPPPPAPVGRAPEWEPRVYAVPPSPAQVAAAREAERKLRYEPWLTEIFAKMATTGPLSHEERHALRLYSDMLALWALCEEPACRRERTCRGSEPHCFGAVGDLVPACALPFLAGFVAGQLDGVAFDAMLAQLPEGAVQHWAIWHAAVARIVERPHRS
ncbi:MAG: hypothetical protein AB7K64_05650 [Variibacter sp.]